MALALLIGACVSCKNAADGGTVPMRRQDTADAGEGEDGTNSESKTATKKAARIDPVSVSINLEKVVGMESSQVVADVKVPRIAMQRNNSDYVQIMRCPSSYVLRTSLGKRLDELVGIANAGDQRRSAWDAAISDSDKCVIVHQKIVAAEYLDIGAKSGSYFYVINPCIRADHSRTNRDECSYRLETTAAFDYENKFLKETLEATIELSKATSELQALIDEMGTQASLLEVRLRGCENWVAHEESLRTLKRALLMAAMFGAGLLLFERGGLLSKIFGPKAGGPNAAAMGGLMSMQMGGMILSQVADVGLHQGIERLCIMGEKAFTKDQAKEGKFNYSNFLDYARSAQDRFHVAATLQRIDDLAKQDPGHTYENQWDPLDGDGLIFRAQVRMKRLIDTIAALDNRTLTIEQTIATVKAAGVDPQDSSSIMDFLGSAGAGGPPK